MFEQFGSKPEQPESEAIDITISPASLETSAAQEAEATSDVPVTPDDGFSQGLEVQGTGEVNPPLTPLSDSESAPRVSFDLTAEEGFATFKLPIAETRIQSLPNQNVGQEFSLQVQEILEFKQIEVSELPAGITFSRESSTLFGNPTEPGQFKIQFLCRDDKGVATVVEYSLVVVPDPKTLWKNIPTDKSAPFWKSDYSAEIESTPNLFAIAASNRGRSHAHEGKFREDDYSMLCVGPGAWSVLCVADGAGSASLSRRGSEIASNVASKRLSSLLETHLTPLLANYSKPVEKISEDQEVSAALYQSLIRAAYEAAVAVKTEAEAHHVDAKAMSTTLLLAAVRKFPIGNVLVGFNIGDGASGVLYNDSKNLYLLCIPEGGDFAGQTKFLHTEEFREENNQSARLRIAVLDTFDAIAVMSDGVSDAKFSSDNALHDAEEWKKLIFDDWKAEVMPTADVKNSKFPDGNDELKKLANNWLDYWAVGTHDDRTLIVAFPKETK